MNYGGTPEALAGFEQEEVKQSSHLDTCQCDLKSIKSLRYKIKKEKVGDRQVSLKM